jgi:hypothetical protein
MTVPGRSRSNAEKVPSSKVGSSINPLLEHPSFSAANAPLASLRFLNVQILWLISGLVPEGVREWAKVTVAPPTTSMFGSSFWAEHPKRLSGLPLLPRLNQPCGKSDAVTKNFGIRFELLGGGVGELATWLAAGVEVGTCEEHEVIVMASKTSATTGSTPRVGSSGSCLREGPLTVKGTAQAHLRGGFREEGRCRLQLILLPPIPRHPALRISQSKILTAAIPEPLDGPKRRIDAPNSRSASGLGTCLLTRGIHHHDCGLVRTGSAVHGL